MNRFKLKLELSTNGVRLLCGYFWLVAACLVAAPASATEIFFFQRGYVAGGTEGATTLTDAAVAAFEKGHPEIQVHIVGVPWSGAGDLKLRTALLAHRRIDLFRVANDELPGFAPKNIDLLSPISPYLTEADRADYGPGALEAVTIRGKMLAWPLWSTALGMIVNEDLLAKAGVALPPEGTGAAPWTWAEFTEALKKCSALKTEAGQPVAGFDAASKPPLFEWSPLLMAHCGPFFTGAGEGDPNASATIALAPKLAAAIGQVRALREAGLAAPGFGFDSQEEAQQGFLEGRTAMLFSSPGFIRKLQATSLHFRVLAPPEGDWGKPITTGALGCFAVVDSGDPERIAAAHALARYLTSREIADGVPGWYLAPPARTSVGKFFDHPAYRPLAAILPTARYMVPPGGAGFWEQAFIPKIQAAVLGQLTPEQAIAEIQAAWKRRTLW